tara:strand:+ start:965 stop:1207 length:243 start_codon:yes stop_codon:yes gene_type:complete
MENPIIWINNPLQYKIIELKTEETINTQSDRTKENKKYNYEHDYAYDFDWEVSYNDFSIPKPGCGRKRSPSFMKTMFSHS